MMTIAQTPQRTSVFVNPNLFQKSLHQDRAARRKFSVLMLCRMMRHAMRYPSLVGQIERLAMVHEP
jgi:hypothetical protein